MTQKTIIALAVGVIVGGILEYSYYYYYYYYYYY